jgi:hypothetical protein
MSALGIVQSLLLILGAADTACAESGRDYRDGAAVLQVVRNRARSGWGRYDGSLWGALWSRGQHAHGCRWPLTVRHLALGWQFVAGSLDAPEWARDALWYCGGYDRPGACAARGGRRVLGRVVHTYWGR